MDADQPSAGSFFHADFHPATNDSNVYGIGYVFKTGEIWSIDTFSLASTRTSAGRVMALPEDYFTESLIEYTRLLRRLGVIGQLRWIAGMDGVRGLGIYPPDRPGYSRFSQAGLGTCMLDEVVAEGEFGDIPDGHTLKPFFEAVYESCGISRPGWLNEKK